MARGVVGGLVGYDAYRAATDPGGSGDRRSEFQARDTDANAAAGDLATAPERAKAADRRRAEADRKLAERRGETNSVKVARTRAELADAEDRVGQAEAGARHLGGLGRAGRQETKVALEMVKRLGVDNVDPETVALAEAADPELVGKLKEQAGEAAKPEFRALSPDSKRFADLGQARKREAGLRERATGQEEAGIRDKAQGIADALKGLAATCERELDFIKVEVEALKRDAERRAGNADR